MKGARLRVVEARLGSAAGRLHHHASRRPALRASFRAAWERIADGGGDADLDAWCEAALALVDAHAGPSALVAFWELSVDLLPEFGFPVLIASARSAAEICGRCGTGGCAAALKASRPAARRLRNVEDFQRWCAALGLLARQAPESVAPFLDRTESVLAECPIAQLDSFVRAGLKYGAVDRTRRRAFFALDDPLARRLLEKQGGGVSFGRVERPLKAFATALWGVPPVLRVLETADGLNVPRRSSVVGGIVRLPDVYRGFADEAARPLFHAAIAHATAHIACGGALFPVGTLKPLQIALVTLVEDARIEHLAMRRFPGLFHLWRPYHLAQASEAGNAPSLLARLARALFDPAFHDGHGFVVKGRALFQAEMGNLADPALSRRIGGLLGNDLGQMRIQFNARTHVVEPVYRDDGYGLWDFGDQPDAKVEELEMFVEAARRVREERPEPPDTSPEEDDGKPAETGKARSVQADARGSIVARYPEWDRAAGVERPEWTTLRDAPAPVADVGNLEAAIDREAGLRRHIARLVRGAKVGRFVRLRRRAEGFELDLDAAIGAAIAMRSRETPDARIFRASERRDRDLAITVLMDVSESTRDPAGEGRTVLDVERLAVALLADALASLDDPFALSAFASSGREDVRFIRIKDFAEPYDVIAKARLAGLESGLSTRLGAALRHAGAELAPVASYRKLLIVLTDGEPSDIDVVGPQDLVEDARLAVLGLKRRGIDTFGVTLDPAGAGSGARIFGAANHIPVKRLGDLPARLSELYFRLARA